jgi:hypothetical protein
MSPRAQHPVLPGPSCERHERVLLELHLMMRPMRGSPSAEHVHGARQRPLHRSDQRGDVLAIA